MIRVHNKHVREHIPKDRLLVLRTEELAWEPLCKFLGKPIPDEPFPRVNDGAAADRLAKWIILKCLLRWTVILGTTAAGSYMACRFATGSLDLQGILHT
jgi:hypothetical protein